MDVEERDAFLSSERTCRVATVGDFHDGRHAWLRIVPDKIVSWDFRELIRR